MYVHTSGTGVAVHTSGTAMAVHTSGTGMAVWARPTLKGDQKTKKM